MSREGRPLMLAPGIGYYVRGQHAQRASDLPYRAFSEAHAAALVDVADAAQNLSVCDNPADHNRCMEALIVALDHLATEMAVEA